MTNVLDDLLIFQSGRRGFRYYKRLDRFLFRYYFLRYPYAFPAWAGVFTVAWYAYIFWIA